MLHIHNSDTGCFATCTQLFEICEVHVTQRLIKSCLRRSLLPDPCPRRAPSQALWGLLMAQPAQQLPCSTSSPAQTTMQRATPLLPASVLLGQNLR